MNINQCKKADELYRLQVRTLQNVIALLLGLYWNKFYPGNKLRVSLRSFIRPVPTDSNSRAYLEKSRLRIATQISATIFIFMCGDRKVAIISANRDPRTTNSASSTENNRDVYFCAKCVRTVNEFNRTGFLYPIMQGGRSVLPVCVRCVFN